LLFYEKKSPDVNPYLVDKVETGQLSKLDIVFYYDTEWDEFWSFVQNKSNQRWTWYAVERKTGLILAYHNGRRTDDSLKQLVQKVAHLPIRICHSDAWAAYEKHLPKAYIHIVGKDNTWKIERKNLNFRTHLKRLSRKTICFSKNEEIHDNVIGMYINKYYFKHGKYANAFAA
jgi:insertion element IS1 protein InsB